MMDPSEPQTITHGQRTIQEEERVSRRMEEQAGGRQKEIEGRGKGDRGWVIKGEG